MTAACQQDIQASEEETNFTSARDVVVTTNQIQHPITYDQFDLCSMAEGDTLKMLKLPTLQLVCEGLGLDVPQPPVRRRAPYMELLKDEELFLCKNEQTLQSTRTVLRPVYKKRVYHISRVILIKIARVYEQNQILMLSSLSSTHNFFLILEHI